MGAAFLAAAGDHRDMWQRHPIQQDRLMLITTNVHHRTLIFKDAACARIAVDTLYSIQNLYAFFLFAFVIMPDHCHLLLRIPEGGSISKTIGVYKRAVAFNLGRGPIWQSRFHAMIPHDPWRALHYVHWNPVRAGLCTEPEQYPWSSACGRWDVQELMTL